jgi:hypothetical protein
MIKSLLTAACLWLVFTGQALAQGAVQQWGTPFAGHAAMFPQPGFVTDAGGPQANGVAPVNTVNPGTMALGYAWVNSGLGTCGFSSYASLPYSTICWGFDGSGNALLTVGAFGGPPPKFNLNLNGTLYPFPFSLQGILGPSITTLGDAAIWNNGTGSLLSDAGGPPLRVNQPASPGVILTAKTVNLLTWSSPISAVPGILLGVQIFCANACEATTPIGIIPTGSTTVTQNCDLGAGGCVYHPDIGTQSIIMEGCGGGGSGAGAAASDSTSHASFGGPGGSGTYFKIKTPAVTGITFYVGDAGAAPSAGANNGNVGTSTETGNITAGGGSAGNAVASVASGVTGLHTPNGFALDPSFVGTVIASETGHPGSPGWYTNSIGMSGFGGSSPFGTGGAGSAGPAQAPGLPGQGYCSGGGGGMSGNNASGTAQVGGAGAPGIVVVWEYNTP